MVKKRMKTEAKTTTMLEKKIEELEYLLEEFGFCDGDLNAYQELKQRFIFTKALLTAEILSVKDGEKEETLKLACMAKRLTELEEAFNKQLIASINKPDMQSLQLVDETGSICSLVESLPEEFQDASFEENAEDAVAGRETDEIKKNRLRGSVSFGLIGFVACMVSFFFGYFCDQKNHDTVFITPT